MRSPPKKKKGDERSKTAKTEKVATARAPATITAGQYQVATATGGKGCMPAGPAATKSPN